MTVWTEEVIENTIFELMKDIGIEDDRMPTHKEMVNNRLSGLGAAIVKQGGIQHWAASKMFLSKNSLSFTEVNA